MKMSVAMATYNGSKFIREQLDSLNSQIRLPDELVICDDGSSDETISIIREFSKVSNFKVRLIQNKERLGYSDNFFKAASLCEGEWVSFCDQDDVWLPGKLSMAAQEIQKNPDLNLILQNAYICDTDLNQHRVFPDKIVPGKYGSLELPGVWVWPGFLQTVNKQVFGSLDYSMRPRDTFSVDQPLAHDKWVCIVANALGGVSITGDPVALYRRHDEAFSGDCVKPSFIESVKVSDNVGEARYKFMRLLMDEYSHYFLTGRGEGFFKCSEFYRDMSEVYRHRERIYSGSGFYGRVKSYMSLWCSGGYLGPIFYRLGIKSSVKDFLRVFGVV